MKNQLAKEFLESDKCKKRKSQNANIWKVQYNLLKEIWAVKKKVIFPFERRVIVNKYSYDVSEGTTAFPVTEPSHLGGYFII